MKMNKPIACVLSAAVLVSVCAGFSASADVNNSSSTAPHTIFCTFNGSAKSSRGFTWYTNSAKLTSQVEIGTKSDLSDAEIITGQDSYEVDGGDRNTGDGVTSDGKTMTPTASVIKAYCHKANVADLTAGTTYYYKVGDASKGWSREGSFTTEADEGNFSFIDVTDTQAAFTDSDYYSNWSSLINKAFNTDSSASFVMDCGDITNNGGDINQWYDFTDAAQRQLMNTTFVPIAGNHETYLAQTSGSYLSVTNNYKNASGSNVSQTCGPYLNSFVNHFNLKLPATETASVEQQGAYYDFNYGDCLFLVLNTNELNKDGTLTDDQLSWLKGESAASDKKWKIVAFHRAVQSIGSHIADVDVQALRAQLLPIMAQDGIDLVLQGHDHTYVRSKQISKDGTPVVSPTEVTETYKGVSTTFGVKPAGTVYIINGASNDKLYVDNYNAKGYEDASKNVYVGFSNPTTTGNTLDEANDPTGGTVATLPTYSVVNVENGKLVVTTYQYNVNTDSQSLIESYGLAKPDQSDLVASINALPALKALNVKNKTTVSKIKDLYKTYNALDGIEKSAVTNSSKLLDLYKKAISSAGGKSRAKK